MNLCYTTKYRRKKLSRKIAFSILAYSTHSTTVIKEELGSLSLSDWASFDCHLTCPSSPLIVCKHPPFEG